MSMEKKSKRQERREKMRKQEQGQRLIWLGVIVVLAAAVVGLMIWNQAKPIASLVPVETKERANIDRNSMGDPNAPVKIEEFSDYQCPYCKQFAENTEPLLEQYYVNTGKVHFTYRSAGNWVSGNVAHYAGTPAKTESQDAAAAAYCAADQGKYWEMHDSLFANNRDVEDQGSFDPRRLTEIAKSIGLDMTAYQSCFDSGKYKDQVAQDYKDATAANIQGTPFFVLSYTVNGQTKTQTIDGAQPFSEFQKQIEAALHEIGQ